MSMSIQEGSTNIVILIVALNKTPAESLSFNSLRRTSVGKNIEVVFWSNYYTGSEKNDEFTRHITCKRNINLSEVYNSVISKISEDKKFNKLIILDDDTDVSDAYIYAMLLSSSDVTVPEVYVSGKKVYPISIVSNLVVEASESKGLKSINSGLCLSRSLIERLIKHNGNVYDERFSFYGTDFSLFYRLDKLGVHLTQAGMVSHNLSRFSEAYRPNEFRWRQKIYENILMWRNYPEYNSRMIIVKVFIKLISNFKYSTFRSAINVLLKNKASINE